jgi:hypothetical protein
MSDQETRLTCGCAVTTSRDFLGRVVGTITERAAGCSREDHLAGRTVLMPGRENASPSVPGRLA